MARIKLISLLPALFIFSACAGELKYTPPVTSYNLNNSFIAAKSKDEVWKTIVPNLGKSFFVINNLEKESGIINVSYSGDPEKYVDCGRIYSYVSNARGQRTYDFPASRGNQHYEIMQGGDYLRIDRKLDCEGRINIIVQELSPDHTQISVNTKYVLTKSSAGYDGMGRLAGQKTDSISFTSGGQAQFPNTATICKANGRLEEEVISILSSGVKQ
jgi:hypothetical protein